MIAVLESAFDIPASRLDVATRVGANPHVFPSWREPHAVPTLNSVFLFDGKSVWSEVFPFDFTFFRGDVSPRNTAE
jgi:hypothetical protein